MAIETGSGASGSDSDWVFMHTRIEMDNPYGYDRYGFAWEHVPAGGAAHLDYGCGDGRFLVGLGN